MMKKILVLALPVILIISAGIWWQWGRVAAPQGMPQRPPLEVETVTIAPQEVSFTRTLSGRTSAYRTAEIRPQVSGIILKKLFVEGSHVKEGDLLFQIDSALYQAAYDRAAADLLHAKTNIATAQARSARFAELVKIGGVSVQEFDDINAQLSQAEAQLAVAEAALSTAKINLEYTKIVAPISGHIGKSFMSEGALVTANQPTPLAIVQQLDPIYVDVAQVSHDLLKLRSIALRTKPKVLLLSEHDSKERRGDLQFCDVSIDHTTGTGNLRIVFPNAQMDILPGVFVRVQIEHSKDKAAILVPHRAVTRNANQSVTVWVVKANNQVSLQPIQISHLIGENWVVTEGLQEGDRVVIAGIQKIMPNMQVTPVDKSKKG